MEINEENYISELKKHNEAALAYIISQYGGLVKSVVKKHLYALSEYQEECLNDVFFLVWNNIGGRFVIDNSIANLNEEAESLTLIPYAVEFPKESGKMSNDFQQTGDAFTINLK